MVCVFFTLFWGLIIMNWVFFCFVILGIEVMILWGVFVSSSVLFLGVVMTMVLAFFGVVVVLVLVLVIDNMDDGIVLMMVFVVEDWKKKIFFMKNIIFFLFVFERGILEKIYLILNKFYSIRYIILLLFLVKLMYENMLI